MNYMDLTLDPFVGCILGLATGDALGAPHEGGFLERLIWRIIGRTEDGSLRWTDDTQMTLDLAESLLAEGDVRPDALAQRFASSYRWNRGYGPGAAKVLKRIRRGEPWETAANTVYAEGSYGNGAAMRAPVLALFFARNRDRIVSAARASARITHAHPEGIEGAVLIAVAAHALLERRPLDEVLMFVRTECATQEILARLTVASSWLEAGEMPGPREVAVKLGNGITAATSCPTAVYIALRHLQSSFEAMIDFILKCRGDVDTIGAMAGSLWGIVNGSERLPNIRLEARSTLVDVATRLFHRHH